MLRVDDISSSPGNYCKLLELLACAYTIPWSIGIQLLEDEIALTPWDDRIK